MVISVTKSLLQSWIKKTFNVFRTHLNIKPFWRKTVNNFTKIYLRHSTRLWKSLGKLNEFIENDHLLWGSLSLVFRKSRCFASMFYKSFSMATFCISIFWFPSLSFPEEIYSSYYLGIKFQIWGPLHITPQFHSSQFFCKWSKVTGSS